MKDKTFCEICSIEINIGLLYKHINSKEHIKIEHYFIRKGKIYCEVCKKELRNDEWREHGILKNHLQTEKKGYCKVCKEKHHVSGGDQYTSYKNKCLIAQDNHNRTENQKEKQERFDIYLN